MSKIVKIVSNETIKKARSAQALVEDGAAALAIDLAVEQAQPDAEREPKYRSKNAFGVCES